MNFQRNILAMASRKCFKVWEIKVLVGITRRCIVFIKNSGLIWQENAEETANICITIITLKWYEVSLSLNVKECLYDDYLTTVQKNRLNNYQLFTGEINSNKIKSEQWLKLFKQSSTIFYNILLKFVLSSLHSVKGKRRVLFRFLHTLNTFSSYLSGHWNKFWIFSKEFPDLPDSFFHRLSFLSCCLQEV